MPPVVMPSVLTLTLADSEVASCSVDPEGLRLRLAAAHVHRTDTGPRATAEPIGGYARGVVLELDGARPLGGGASSHGGQGDVRAGPASRLAAPAAGLVGRIAHGRVGFGGRWMSSLPLPADLVGEVVLELDLAQGPALAWRATRLVCRYEGEPNFAESLFC